MRAGSRDSPWVVFQRYPDERCVCWVGSVSLSAELSGPVSFLQQLALSVLGLASAVSPVDISVPALLFPYSAPTLSHYQQLLVLFLAMLPREQPSSVLLPTPALELRDQESRILPSA